MNIWVECLYVTKIQYQPFEIFSSSLPVKSQRVVDSKNLKTCSFQDSYEIVGNQLLRNKRLLTFTCS